MALPFCARDGRYFLLVYSVSSIYGTVAQGKRWGDYANGDDVRDDGSWIAHEQRFAHRLGVGSVGSMID